MRSILAALLAALVFSPWATGSAGFAQFRFWVDRNGNSVLGDAGDVLLRTWTDNPVILDAPDVTARFGVQVRCSALPTCAGSTTTLVTVPCPSTGTAMAPSASRSASAARHSWAGRPRLKSTPSGATWERSARAEGSSTGRSRLAWGTT